MSSDFDIVIVGSGPGGSLLALAARQIGLRVLLVEKGQHPRFAIGESTSPLANLVLEGLCDRYSLSRIRPLCAYGSWMQVHPGIVRGLKRGFTFYHHCAGEPFRRWSDRRTELLVAASPSDRVADTHWLRSDVDRFLVHEAIAAGVEYCDRTSVEAVDAGADVNCVQARTGNRCWSATAALLIDATGPGGQLSRMLGAQSHTFSTCGGTQALYSHFESLPLSSDGADLTYQIDECEKQQLPYRPEWAAVHHVFDGGWVWSLRFDNGLTSAGIAVRPWLAAELGLGRGDEPGARAWKRLGERFPSLEPLCSASPVRPFDFIGALPHRTDRAAGPGWALLPGAAAFVDPFLSTGLPLTFLGVERLATVLERSWRNGFLNAEALQTGLMEYDRITLDEADAAANLVAGCYAAFAHFELLSAFLMYYFAAASFAEVTRRLGKAELGGLFLRADDPEFQRAIQTSCERLSRWDRVDGPCQERPTGAEVVSFRDQIRLAIDRINVAGLMDEKRRNWYPVRLEDLVVNAAKLGETASTMAECIPRFPM